LVVRNIEVEQLLLEVKFLTTVLYTVVVFINLEQE